MIIKIVNFEFFIILINNSSVNLEIIHDKNEVDDLKVNND